MTCLVCDIDLVNSTVLNGNSALNKTSINFCQNRGALMPIKGADLGWKERRKEHIENGGFTVQKRGGRQT